MGFSGIFPGGEGQLADAYLSLYKDSYSSDGLAVIDARTKAALDKLYAEYLIKLNPEIPGDVVGNTIEKALIVGLGLTEGVIETGKDKDWFAIPVLASYDYTITSKGKEGFGPMDLIRWSDARLYNSSGTEVGWIAPVPYEARSFEFKSVKDGFLFVKLAPYYPDYYGKYEFNVSTKRSGTPTESYILNLSSASINEGEKILTTLATTNVASGITLYYTLSGTGITAVDFSTGALAGSGSIGTDGKLSISHTLANDLTTEGAETVEIKLFSDEARKVQVGSTASVSISDTSMTPPPQISVAATANGKETDGSPVVFTFTRTGSTSSALSINYQLFGTAKAGSDYTGNISGSVSFAAGSATATLSLPALADGALIDPGETIIARINPSAIYRITTGKQFASATITAEGMVVASKAVARVGWSTGEKQNNSAYAALKSDGTVVIWGENWSGSKWVSMEAPSGLNGVSQIFSNGEAFAALKSDGNVVTWGESSHGGTTPAGLSGNAQVSSNNPNNQAYAVIKSDGTAVTWGSGGTGSTGLAGISKIFSTESAFSALTSDGTVISWGNKETGGSAPKALNGVVEIFSNDVAFAALKGDGTVTTWGDSTRGGAVPSGLTGVTKIFSNPYAFAALKSDGTVVAWGSNSDGGNVPALLSGVIDVVSSSRSFAALKNDGTVVSWGSHGYAPIGLSDVSRIFSSNLAFAALKTDGTVVAWGEADYGGNAPNTLSGVRQIFSSNFAFAALKDDGSVSAWGNKNFGGEAPLGLSGVTSIFSNGYAFAALKSDGTVTTWGDSTRGGTAPVGLSGVTNIFFNSYSFVALKNNGSIVTWGDSTRGGIAPAGLTNVVGFANPYTDDRLILEDKTTPTYTLTPSATTINEGSTLTTSVATTNVASATTLYYSLSGTGITAADFSTGALTGSGTIGTDGKFSISHTLANDLTTEGAETVEIKLFSDDARKVQVGATATVAIKDTSVASAIKIENNGVIELMKGSGNKYSAQSKVVGAINYAIKKDGKQIYQGVYGNDWSVLAAETVNGVNQVLWKNTAANRLHLWKLDGNWNWQSSSLWDEASSSIGQQLETEFDIDLDGNGTVAVASAAKIENNGAIELVKGLGNKYSAQSKVAGATSYAIKKDGNQIYQGIYGNDWSVLAAETVNGVNQVLWKNTAANRLHLWKLDGNWNWQSSSLWDEASSSIGQQLETEFDIDLDGNGTVAVASAAKIENNGVIELMKGSGNKYSAQSKVVGVINYAIKKDGNQIYQGVYGNDWSVLAAETVNGVNQVLWKNTAANRLHLWKLDGNWNWQSSSLWDEASSSIGQQLETEFDIDLDGNGTVAVASAIKFENIGSLKTLMGTINNDIITGQGGEIVYGGKGSDRITGQSKISADGTRRIPSFLTGGSGDDTYVVPQGVFSVILDAGDGLDTVNMSGSNIDNIQFIRVNQRDIYAADATTGLLLIDPQGIEGKYNAIESFIIGNNKYGLTQLTSMAFGSSNFYGDYTYRELQSNGFFDLGIVGLDPLSINGYIELVINNNLLS